MSFLVVKKRIQQDSFQRFIFLFLYLGIAMSAVGLSAYISWPLLSFLGLYWLYRLIKKVRVSNTEFWHVLLVGVYFIVFTCIFIVLSGTDARVAFQNTFQILLFYLLTLGCYIDKELVDVDVLVIGYIRVVTVASIINIGLTIISLVRGESQEGYRIMLMGIVIGLYVMLMYRHRNPQCKLLIPITFSVIAIAVSYSKQAYLSMAVLVFLLIITAKSVKASITLLMKITVCAIGIVIVILLLAKYISRIQTIVDALSYNVQILVNGDRLISQESYRITEMREGFAVFKEHIFFGIGSGTKYTSFGLENWVHNNWLWFLLDFGIVGTCIFAFPIIKNALCSFTKGARLKDKDYKEAVIYFILAGVIALTFFNALFAPVIFRDPMSLCIMTLFYGTILRNNKL